MNPLDCLALELARHTQGTCCGWVEGSPYFIEGGAAPAALRTIEHGACAVIGAEWSGVLAEIPPALAPALRALESDVSRPITGARRGWDRTLSELRTWAFSEVNVVVVQWCSAFPPVPREIARYLHDGDQVLSVPINPDVDPSQLFKGIEKHIIRVRVDDGAVFGWCRETGEAFAALRGAALNARGGTA